MKNTVTSLVLLALFFVFPAMSFSQSAPDRIQFKTEIKGSFDEVVRLNKLASETQAVVNHPEFEKRVRGAWTKYGKAFSYSDDSGDQVFQKMLGTWNLFYEFQPQARKCVGVGRFKKCTSWVLGWTNPSTKTVYLNSLPWPGRDDSGIVGTLVHEQLHKLGYGHPFNNTSTRPLSVPYAVGNIAAEIHKKYFLK